MPKKTGFSDRMSEHKIYLEVQSALEDIVAAERNIDFSPLKNAKMKLQKIINHYHEEPEGLLF